MAAPVRKPGTEPEPVPVIVLDRTQQRVYEWRTKWLKHAGWSEDRADFIARITAMDLVEWGFSQDEADRVVIELWRQACSAIKCGSEGEALYLLGLASEH